MILRRHHRLEFAVALLGSALCACHEPDAAQLNSVSPTHSALAPKPTQPAVPMPSVPAPRPSAETAGTGGRLEPGSSSGSDSSAAAAAGSGTMLGLAPGGRVSAESAPDWFDAMGKPLPQSDARPASSSAAFETRIAAVARAIVSGDVEPALSAFFPLVAYEQVKDIAKPERDYKYRLLAHFKRDLLEYHRALGAAASEAKFQGITVPERDAKWMAPGSEGNKVGYFRVLRSHLRFALPTGRSRDFELTSMISWRGEWYVVHLHGFE